MPTSDDQVLGHWGHSFEEDDAGVQVYRPAGYAFPLARGRAGLEFRAGGELVEWAIGPGDGSEPRPGHWWCDDTGRVRLQTPDGRTGVADVDESAEGGRVLRMPGRS